MRTPWHMTIYLTATAAYTSYQVHLPADVFLVMAVLAATGCGSAASIGTTRLLLRTINNLTTPVVNYDTGEVLAEAMCSTGTDGTRGIPASFNVVIPIGITLTREAPLFAFFDAGAGYGLASLTLRGVYADR